MQKLNIKQILPKKKYLELILFEVKSLHGTKLNI